MWLLAAAAVVSVTGAVAAAVVHVAREMARARTMVRLARLLPLGGSVRYRSVDGQGAAAAEWELTLPASCACPEVPPARRGKGRSGAGR